MNVICNKNILNEAISSVSKAVSSHSNFPVLEGILIKADIDGTMTFVSNDMEMGIEAKIEARVIKPGQTVLNAKMLGSINSPASGLVYSVNGVMAALTRAVAAVRDQKTA